MKKPELVDEVAEFPSAIKFLAGLHFDPRTDADLRREGYEPVGRPVKQPYNPELGFPLGKRPARLAIILVNEANPQGLMYDGIGLRRETKEDSLGRKRECVWYQAYYKPQGTS